MSLYAVPIIWDKSYSDYILMLFALAERAAIPLRLMDHYCTTPNQTVILDGVTYFTPIPWSHFSSEPLVLLFTQEPAKLTLEYSQILPLALRIKSLFLSHDSTETPALQLAKELQESLHALYTSGSAIAYN